MRRAACAGLAAVAALALAGWFAARAAIDYRVSISGSADDALAEKLAGLSELERLRDRPPATLTLLRRRADGDVERLTRALRAEGYYAGTVEYRIDPPAETEEAAADPAHVELHLAPGAPYLLEDFTIAFRGAGADAARGLTYQALGLARRERAHAERLLGAERQVVSHLARHGHPFAQVLDRDVVVDHARRDVSVSLAIDAGAEARFGTVSIEGLRTVRPTVVHRAITWREGAIFDSDKIRQTRSAIGGVGLFSSVRIAYPDQPDPAGEVPIRIIVAEGDHRSIGAGLKYATDEGPGAKLFWEHRNVFGDGEAFRIEGIAAELRQALTASLRTPAFLRSGQALALTASAERETVDAFDAERIGAAASIERSFGPLLTGSVGIALEHSRVEDDLGEERFTLLGLPVTLNRDTTNDVLDPTTGGRLTLSATPYLSLTGAGGNFLVARLSDSIHLAFGPEQRLVLATRGIAGAILGADRLDVPTDKRFYAGGGDTIRGFGFQLVGPLDGDDDPIGGRSILAGAIELRGRLTDTIGLVAFIDGGNVYRDPVPDFADELRFGGGLGARYFTPIGPLRFDVAVPLNGREVDDAFQIYVSLGQAF